MNKKTIAFLIVVTTIILLFSAITNYLLSPNYVWSVYPSFAVMCWPLSAYLISKKQYKLLSIIGALTAIPFFVIINYMSSPNHPWFLFIIFPILWWPIIQFTGKSAITFGFSALSSSIFIIYYMSLNYLIWSAYPWCIYTTFVFIWWPIVVYFKKNPKPFIFSIIGTLLISIFSIIVNYISSPNTFGLSTQFSQYYGGH